MGRRKSGPIAHRATSGLCHGGGLEATALEAEVWIQTVTKNGRRFMAAWRNDKVDAARRHQVKREVTRLETLLSHSQA